MAFRQISMVIGLLLVFITPSLSYGISGEISGEETWSGTVNLTGDITVSADGKLTIMPGTTIFCESRFDEITSGVHSSRIELIIDGGKLVAEGNESEPIRFISISEEPAKDDWYGIRIKSDQVTLRYCHIEYGVNGIQIEQNGSPIIENCTIRYCSKKWNSDR
jgi:hypothetical protein